MLVLGFDGSSLLLIWQGVEVIATIVIVALAFSKMASDAAGAIKKKPLLLPGHKEPRHFVAFANLQSLFWHLP